MKLLTLDDLEKKASQRIEKSVFDFWQSGAGDLSTLKENRNAFSRYKIIGRTMVDVSRLDTSPKNELFGKKFRAPIGVAPSSHHTLASPRGELATAGACENTKVPIGLSSYSNYSGAEVKDAAPNSAVFFQLYVFKNRKVSEQLVRRAEQAGYKAILLTSDTPYLGQRYADARNNFRLPRNVRLGNFEDLDDGKGNKIKIPHPVEQKKGDSQTASNVIDPSLNWAETIPWLKSITNMQIWAKGIICGEDAQLAIDAGIDGIWVSNHGGRQLDETLPTIEALQDVVDAVKGRVPVHLDGGVRTGADIFKALAIGADFVWVGRPALWGLACNGQKGVEKMLEILIKDLSITMGLAGTPSVADISRKSIVRFGPRYSKL
ncbi:Cyb2p [Sugiyamaella lignohabitans]|uniref:Oxidase FUB9 n=1 Tax=Sugiyamaella lignohabitans TaxID=796027 RepID=A0A167FUT7_9ASCO|nr:Cyb2p [Sugiyamaella lignohabitans]ANB15729.1 Cyb2p [Sugiyamaella lignohabitans]